VDGYLDPTMASVSRLTSAFSQSMVMLGRRSRSSSGPRKETTVEEDKKTKSSSEPRFLVTSHRIRWNDKSENQILEFKIVMGSTDQAEEGIWISAEVCLECWPTTVLNYYLSSLVFGVGKTELCKKENKNIDEREEQLTAASEEEDELKLIRHLVILGLKFVKRDMIKRKQQGDTNTTVIVTNLIQLRHDNSILALVVISDSVPKGF